MEQNNFKVKYIRLNKPCHLRVELKNRIDGLDFVVIEAYFREYTDGFDAFYIIKGTKKTYIKTVKMNKILYGDTINFHINALKSGYYKISDDDIVKMEYCRGVNHTINKLEEDIYGKK